MCATLFTMRSAFGRTLVTALMAFGMGAPYAFAHVFENIVPASPGENRMQPSLPEEPEQLFDEVTNDMVLQPQEHTCEELLSLDHDAKHFLWDRIINFRIGNILPRIIGPDCAVFGETRPLALIRDPELLPGNAKEETLYYLPSMESIFLSDSTHAGIWYALKTSGTGSFVEEFVDRRADALQQATFMESLDVAFTELRDTRAAASEANRFAPEPAELPPSSAAARSEAVEDKTGSSQSEFALSEDRSDSVPPSPGETIGSSSAAAGFSMGSDTDAEEQTEPNGLPDEGSAQDSNLPVINAPDGQTQNETPVMALVIAILTIIALAAYAVYRLRKSAKGTNEEGSAEPSPEKNRS